MTIAKHVLILPISHLIVMYAKIYIIIVLSMGFVIKSVLINVWIIVNKLLAIVMNVLV